MPSDGSYQTAEGSSRKRLKTNSRDAGRPAGYPSKSPEVVSLVTPVKKEQPALKQENGHTNNCVHEESLRTLHGDLDAMRQLITCKICQRFLYEPYALTCGHTFCYSCLSQWMGQNHKKTCPDCRTVIKEQPAPSYLVRELVLVFTSRNELLPDGETLEEHNQVAKEEADVVAKDKSNMDVRTGGLFKGCFKKGNRLVPLIAIRDASDNVDRCPQCLHEVEDGRCNICNVRVRTEDDDSEDDDLDWSDDEDEELDQEFLEDLARDADADLAYDDYSDSGGFGPYNEVPFGQPISIGSDDEDDSEEEDDGDLEGFVAGDDEPMRHYNDDSISVDQSDSEATEVEIDARPRPGRTRHHRRQAPIVLSDDEEEEDEDVIHWNTRQVPQAPSADSDEDDSEEVPVRPSQRGRRNMLPARLTRRPLTIASDPSDDEDEDESATEAECQPVVTGGFSPLQYAGNDSDGASNGAEYYEGHGDEEEPEDYSSQYGETGYDGYDGYGAEDDGEDSMGDASDEQSTATGYQHPTPRDAVVDSHANEETGIDQPDLTNRLHTLGPHCSRYTDPPSFSSPFQDTAPRFTTSRTHAPAHPFNLENTLASIRQNRLQSTGRTGSRRTRSAVSSQSSAGGVDVPSSASGSSGSSMTIRPENAPVNAFRRRFLHVGSDSE